jgi:hypothetical protein
MLIVLEKTISIRFEICKLSALSFSPSQSRVFLHYHSHTHTYMYTYRHLLTIVQHKSVALPLWFLLAVIGQFTELEGKFGDNFSKLGVGRDPYMEGTVWGSWLPRSTLTLATLAVLCGVCVRERERCSLQHTYIHQTYIYIQHTHTHIYIHTQLNIKSTPCIRFCILYF